MEKLDKLDKLGKLIGNDASIEISLKEYGFAWVENNNSYTFYYGIHGIDSEDDGYEFFGSYNIGKNVDIREEYDWVEFKDVESFIGRPFDDLSFTQKICDLYGYYGGINVFGTNYERFELTYEEVLKITGTEE